MPKTSRRAEQQISKLEECNLILMAVHMAALSGTIYFKILGILTLKEFKICFRWELWKLKFEEIASGNIVVGELYK